MNTQQLWEKCLMSWDCLSAYSLWDLRSEDIHINIFHVIIFQLQVALKLETHSHLTFNKTYFPFWKTKDFLLSFLAISLRVIQILNIGVRDDLAVC